MRTFLFYKNGHNFETEAKLNKARHTLSNELSFSVAAKDLAFSTLNSWVPDFRFFGFMEDANGQGLFLRSAIKKGKN